MLTQGLMPVDAVSKAKFLVLPGEPSLWILTFFTPRHYLVEITVGG